MIYAHDTAFGAFGEPRMNPITDPAGAQREEADWQRRAPAIVGYMVHSDGVAHAALYNLSERDKAFDAAKRWGAAITALVCHPNGPEVIAAATGAPE